MCDAKIVKDGKTVAMVYTGSQINVIKSCKTGKLQEFKDLKELESMVIKFGGELVLGYNQLPELQKLSN